MISSSILKIAVLSKYRYKLQQIAADEVDMFYGNTDISVWDSNVLTEIEIKTSKSDLVHGEAKKKEKHDHYKSPTDRDLQHKYIPNYFYVCVPTTLLPDAKSWVKSINKNYGILEYRASKEQGVWKCRPEDMIYISKRAKPLVQCEHTWALKKLARRLSSVNITLKTKLQDIITGPNYNVQQKEAPCLNQST